MKKVTGILITDGGIVGRNGKETMAMAQCMGQAILDGNLKGKVFSNDGTYFVANQVKVGQSTANSVRRFDNLQAAIDAFDETPEAPAKILVDGKSGHIERQSGEQAWVNQNLIYMYQHMHGLVQSEPYKK